MTEEVNFCIEEAKERMEKAIAHLENELRVIRAGKANPSMLSGIMVDYYGTMTPLQQVSNVGTLDARTITVQPWEKAMIAPIEKAILGANLGFNPQNNGEVIRIAVPPLTEERRKQLVKQVKAEGENARVSIRNARRDANDEFKKMQKDGLPEDMAKDAEGEVQKMTDTFNKKVEELLQKKEEEILTV
ncbi:MAG: ribosome recycling factor [Tenuifilaceae bacterium]|jgi:ribosome recycling factor|uniref:ribosome recycling factor n=1 Tax=Perlabentimonas gracilis TaxID=2715279 RepID=UPI00140DB2A3|nr:ribosome recycling factor [Perlabentimonas gracilis]MDX9769939.1 ribosome recycling factor [Tenuifilaceae bacterium]NHB67621.1 ribosome recycling factor [Perlabentimonas gracilis]